MRHLSAAIAFCLASAGCGRTDPYAPRNLVAPRPVAPLSTLRITSQRPLLHWQSRPGTSRTRVEICRAPDCATVNRSLDVAGDHVRIADPLAPGVWFWRVREEDQGRVSGASDPPWEFFVPLRDADATAAGDAWMDFDRDGRVDFVLVEENRDGTKTIDVHLGRDGSPWTRVSSTLRTEGLRPNFGAGSHAAADVNGDGYGDLLVPDTYNSARPRVYLGGDDGLNPDRFWELPLGTEADRIEDAAAVGDVDGDGYGDILLAATNGLTDTDRRFVRLVRGGPSRWQGTIDRSEFGTTPFIGFALAHRIVGDVNGDGRADLVFADRVPGHGFPGCADTSGYLFFGGDEVLRGPPAAILRDTGGRTFGDAAYIAGSDDFNGDGRLDVAVRTCSEPAPMGGAATIFAGGPNGFETTPTQRFDVSWGAAVSIAWPVGDLDADGYGDVCVQIREGTEMVARLLPGGPDGVSAPPGVPLGRWIVMRGVGDLDGDGIDDGLASDWLPSGSAARVCLGRRGGEVVCGDVVRAAVP